MKTINQAQFYYTQRPLCNYTSFICSLSFRYTSSCHQVIASTSLRCTKVKRNVLVVQSLTLRTLWLDLWSSSYFFFFQTKGIKGKKSHSFKKCLLRTILCQALDKNVAPQGAHWTLGNRQVYVFNACDICDKAIYEEQVPYAASGWQEHNTKGGLIKEVILDLSLKK